MPPPPAVAGAPAIKPIAGTLIDSEHPLARGLIGAWDNLERRSLRAFNGAPDGYPWRGVVFGTYAQTGGTHDPWTLNGAWYYDVSGPSAGFYEMPGSFSIEAFVRTSASGLQVLFGAQNVASGNGWILANTGGNKIEFNFWSGSADQRVTSPLSYNDGRWHHVIGVRDADRGVSTLYVDGQPVATASTAQNVISISAARVFIGAALFGSSPTFLWGGSIARVRIWRGRTLSTQDVAQLYADPYAFYRRPLWDGVTWGPASVPTVTTLAATLVGASSATLNGTVTAGGAEATPAFEYGLQSDLSDAAEVGTTPATVDGDDVAVSAALSDLLSETTYYFRVKAENISGTGTGSILSFETDAAPAVGRPAPSGSGEFQRPASGSGRFQRPPGGGGSYGRPPSGGAAR